VGFVGLILTGWFIAPLTSIGDKSPKEIDKKINKIKKNIVILKIISIFVLWITVHSSQPMRTCSLNEVLKKVGLPELFLCEFYDENGNRKKIV
jgi:hypothetical protein